MERQTHAHRIFKVQHDCQTASLECILHRLAQWSGTAVVSGSSDLALLHATLRRNLMLVCQSCPAGMRLQRRAAQEVLENLRVRLEFAVARLPCEIYDDGMGRKGAEQARLEHERPTVLVDTHVVQRIILAVEGLMRTDGKIVEASVHLRFEHCWADPLALLLRFVDRRRRVGVVPQQGSTGVGAEFVLLLSDILEDVLELR
mmetsp:Transcript_8265/g.20834  ORF Transcript_8265/g.20834 Transcript_8265/m.20834 type:complete len:202 (+) Transcript_8265:34-639(+)